MAETIGYTVAVILLLLGVTVMIVSMRSLLRGGSPADAGPAEPAERGQPGRGLVA